MQLENIGITGGPKEIDEIIEGKHPRFILIRQSQEKIGDRDELNGPERDTAINNIIKDKTNSKYYAITYLYEGRCNYFRGINVTTILPFYAEYPIITNFINYLIVIFILCICPFLLWNLPIYYLGVCMIGLIVFWLLSYSRCFKQNASKIIRGDRPFISPREARSYLFFILGWSYILLFFATQGYPKGKMRIDDFAELMYKMLSVNGIIGAPIPYLLIEVFVFVSTLWIFVVLINRTLYNISGLQPYIPGIVTSIRDLIKNQLRRWK